ncbi:hypothetical protein FNV43_RR13438 [Rhamnella rubrinervis]|uniref:Gnk2-homologous domain-containing protein n=1 Tax=Rhamnella rubrinervis TaxID=2594499 RepID=A0A8K0H169_9ROSA|nr:hypothetical protein FNV43_RR13438 [Rhamnella rubrinervis]
MSCSKSMPLTFLLFSVFFHLGNAADPLYHICFNPENYTAKSAFGANLNTLFNVLSVQVPPSGFGVVSTGQYYNKVNGLALCRGDVSSTKCKTCVVDASYELRNLCSYNKGAVICTGEMELEESEKLYGLAQCTRDLSNFDCKKCLFEAISKIPNCCSGKRGGMVVGASFTTVHYELYPIVNGTGY